MNYYNIKYYFLLAFFLGININNAISMDYYIKNDFSIIESNYFKKKSMVFLDLKYEDNQYIEDTSDEKSEEKFDGSYEEISKEVINKISYNTIKEAEFNQDFELSESTLSADVLNTFIEKQPNLTKLHLIGNFLGDEGISCINQLKNLSDLNVSKNGLGNNGLKNTISSITSLTILDISGNNSFDINGLKSLKNVISGLHNFYCDFTNIDDSGIKFIVENSSKIQTLSLRGIDLSPNGMDSLLSIKTLTSIDISYNPVLKNKLEDFTYKMKMNSVNVISDFMRYL
jgi:hypothetical protein